MEITENYKTYQKKVLDEISLGEIINAVESIRFLISIVPESNEIVDCADEIANNFDTTIAGFQTGDCCPKCGNSLYLSDLPQYDSVCYICDENF